MGARTTRWPVPGIISSGLGARLTRDQEDVDLLLNVRDNAPCECRLRICCQSILSKANASDERDGDGVTVVHARAAALCWARPA